MSNQYTMTTEDDYIVEDRGFDTPCWTWQKFKNPKGYGMHNRGGSQLAHRWYYERDKGEVPHGMQVDHLCRNRDCVNPDHMEVVTPAVNARRGLKTKLTPEQVSEIRTLRNGGADVETLSQDFGISKCHIYKICSHDAWTGE